MARAISNRLAKEFIKGGKYFFLLNYINSTPELSLEVRIKGRVIVYYQKSKVLTLYPVREPELLSPGYFNGKTSPLLDLQFPNAYFEYAMKLIDNHTKPSVEFIIQQKILRDNSDLRHSYLVIDMEYQFAQEKVQNRTEQNTRFDLVAIDLRTYKIVLMELKQGLDAVSGDSGVDDHLDKYIEHGKRSDFRNALTEDVKHIIRGKHLLNVFDFNVEDLLNRIDETSDIEYKMVFAFSNTNEKEKFKQQNEVCPTIYIDRSSEKYVL